MSKATTGPEIERLVQLLARLPGLGPRSARKAALGLLKKRQELLVPLSDALRTAVEKIVEKYRDVRKDGERFLDTYRRIGNDVFKEAVYG